ncbi:hypothetical protein [Lapidilactobacillus dextrinicus]|uniref:hypothetical protein n=1 Tax=Lapidilactobacillus dextrinicus TaxID=51664 RepID=UPI003F2647F4
MIEVHATAMYYNKTFVFPYDEAEQAYKNHTSVIDSWSPEMTHMNLQEIFSDKYGK